MLKNLSPTGRKAVIQAQEEARKLGRQKIDTTELLLSLLSQPSCFAALLKERDVTYERALAAVTELNPATTSIVDGHIPFTDQAQHIIELAANVDHLSTKQDSIHDIHLLICLFGVADTTALSVLKKLGCDQQLLDKLVRMVGLPTSFEFGEYRIESVQELRQEVLEKIETSTDATIFAALHQLASHMNRQRLNELAALLNK